MPLPSLAPEDEVVVPWSDASQHPATHVRSTLLSSSLQTLKALGHYERYLEHLPEAHHDAVLRTLAPTWLPIEDGLAHYRACDALQLGSGEMQKMGAGVGDRIQGTFLGQLGRSARDAGATPWIPLSQFQKLWDRLFQGGGVRVVKTGPKDARIDLRGCALNEIPYFNVGFLGVIQAATEVFARRAYVKVVRGSQRGTQVSFSVSWV